MARKASAAPKMQPPAEKPKRASRRTTPSPETLSALGLERLIAVILDETAQNPAFRKRVTAAIASLQGPDAVAALIDRRLTALERAGGFIDWQKRRAFTADLRATIATITRELVPLDRDQGLDRLVRFLLGAPGVLGRVEDANGRVLGIYEDATHAAADIAATLPPDQVGVFAARLVIYLKFDPFGIIEALLLTLVPGLPAAAIPGLDRDLAEAADAAKPKASRDWNAEMRWMRLVRLRQALADRQGDVDGFIALETMVSPERPNRIAVASRLLTADRPGEALDWLRRAQKPGIRVLTREAMIGGNPQPEEPERERLALEAAILDALGRNAEAQALRWARFEETLDAEILRDYLAKLPDFEDEEALERAFDHAATHPQPYRSLNFLIRWPHLDRAARLVEARAALWEGDRYEVLGPAAEALAQDHPIPASRLYRLLVEDILESGRSAAYGHGASYLVQLDTLADALRPGSLTPDHAAWRQGLRKAHGRKAAFWSLVGR